MTTKPSTNKVRITADLPVNEVRILRDLAALQNISLTEALRRAIATEGLVQTRRTEGNKLLLEKNGEFKEVIFTR